MGTGTPTVTISGIAAANAVLKECGKEPFAWRPGMPDYVRDVPRGFDVVPHIAQGAQDAALVRAARRCCFCVRPRCNARRRALDVPGIMRRVAVGNFVGAQRLTRAGMGTNTEESLPLLERACLRARQGEAPVPIAFVIGQLLRRP